MKTLSSTLHFTASGLISESFTHTLYSVPVTDEEATLAEDFATMLHAKNAAEGTLLDVTEVAKIPVKIPVVGTKTETVDAELVIAIA